jgi:hypothetical protein
MESIAENTTLIQVPKTADVLCEPTSQQTFIVNIADIHCEPTSQQTFIVNIADVHCEPTSSR